MKSSLNRKLQKLLELDTERPELLTSLEDLSSWYGPNTKEARRNLRSDIERNNLEINIAFLEAFSQVQKVRSCKNNPSSNLTYELTLEFGCRASGC